MVAFRGPGIKRAAVDFHIVEQSGIQIEDKRLRVVAFYLQTHGYQFASLPLPRHGSEATCWFHV
eukprot:2151933-Alexandrium_andersonii.AAC.1